MIVLSERFDENNVNYIGCDSHAETIRAVEYLITLGHRRIAFGMYQVPDWDHIDRLAGYRKALEEHGISFDARLTFKQHASYAGGASAIKMMMSMPDPPTAVYFADPSLAVGAINKAHQAGIRVPQDIAVVGFDDAEVRHSIYPAMTAVCQDVGRLGFEAATELVRIVQGESTGSVQRVLPTFFEVNQSTGPPREAPAEFLSERTRAVLARGDTETG